MSHAAKLSPVLVTALALASPALADVTWSGAVDTDFNDGGNWVDGVAPVEYDPFPGTTNGDVVIFDGNTTPAPSNMTPTLSADFWAQGAVFETSGWTLDTGSSTLSVSWRGGNDIRSNATSGVNTINGTIRFGARDTNDFSDIYVAAGGTLRINANLGLMPDKAGGGGNSSGGVNITGPGTVELNTTGALGVTGLRIFDGTVKLFSETAGGVTGDGNGGLSNQNNRNLRLDGGKLDVNGATSALKLRTLDLTVGSELTNSSVTAATIDIAQTNNRTFAGLISGNLAMSYGANSDARVTTVTGDNTYTGDTVIQRGALIVDNVSGSGTGLGDVTVTEDTTLGGTGSLAGNVAFDDGAIFLAQIAGALNIDGLIDAAGGIITTDDTLTLSSYTVLTHGLNALTGAFTVDASVTGQNYAVVYNAESVTLELIPEPASLALLGLGGVMMLTRRRTA